MINTLLVKQYTDSILLQYLSKPKAYLTLKSFIELIMIYDVMISVRDGYNPENVIGVQADILGKYLGIQRVTKGQSSIGSAFGYIDYSATPPVTGILKYLDYSDVLGGHFLDYSDGEAYTLSDTEFRIIISLAIKMRHGNSSLKNIHEILFPIFGSSYLVVETKMQVHYFVQSVHMRLANLIDSLGLFPRPMGVKSSLTIKNELSS